MTQDELSTVDRLCAVLRRHGVVRWVDDGKTIEFATAPPPVKAETPGADPDLCRCGHQSFAHTNGLCIHGCEVERCAPPEAPA